MNSKLLPILVIASCLCATVGVDMAWGDHTTIISIQTSDGTIVQDAVLNVLEPGGQALSPEALGDGTFRVDVPEKYGNKLVLVISSKEFQASEEVFEVALPAPMSNVLVHLDSRTMQVTSARYGSPYISASPQASSAAGALMTRAVDGAIPTGGPPCGPEEITQSLDTTTITPLNSVSCNAGGLHTDNSYIRAFTAADGLSPVFDVCSVTIAVETATGAGGDQPIEVRLYNTADVTNLNAGTMIGSAPFTVLDGEAFFIDIPVLGTTNTGELSVEIFTPEGQTEGNSFFIGSNPNGQTAPSYLAAEACGVTVPTDTAALGFPGMHIIMTVVGSGLCGDGTCDPSIGEDCCTCPADCGDCVCGDGTCEPCEDCVICIEDCGGPGLCECGNGIVEEELGEECDPPDGMNCLPDCTLDCDPNPDCNCDGECGGGGGCGDCDVPNPAGLPGCSDDVCEAIVCAIDPFCCQTAWDGICASEALDLCNCVGPNENCVTCPGDCDDGPGGDLCVCGNGIVEEELGEECDPPDGGVTCEDDCTFPPPPPCCDGTELEEGEACGDDTNGGCNSSPPAFVDANCGDTFCGTAWADGGTRDTDWYLISHAGGIVSATVASAIPTTLFVVDGVCDCAPVVVGDIGCGDGCASIAPGSADLPAGNYVIFVGAGDCGGGGIFEGFPCDNPLGNEYSVSITCNQGEEPVCGNGIIEGCEECDDGNTVPGDGCDENCFLEPCPGEGGDCCIDGGNGTPGCDDVDCCLLVCGIDPFCCDVSWDGICAGEALDLCEVCLENCGNGTCAPPETTDNCPQDCFCGNGTIDPPGESCEPPGTDDCDENCQIIVGNDECLDAIPLEVPSSTMGATIGAGVDAIPDQCGTSVNSPGVWYSVIGTGNTMTASTCTDFFDYDTKITVLCQGCDVLTCIDGNDDNCPDGASGLLSTVTWCSQAGAEYLILVHGFGGQSGVFQLEVFDDGMPCSGGVQCIILGACCVDGACVGDTPEPECLEMGGVWFEGETCAGGFVGYTVEECANPYVDISGTGVLIPAPSNGDDAGEVVPLGFTFNFYGDDHGDIGVGSNGYLTFGPDLTDFSNDPIPTGTDPNDLIAPWWDDWDPAPNGDVYTQQFADPVRTMFQWTEVEHFPGGSSGLFASFQAILFEDGAIEFRYGDPLGLDSPTIGVENQDGTVGTAYDPGMVGPGTCLRFTPLFEAGFDCAGACCQCDGPDQFCSIESLADCTALDGEFLGTGTVCEGAAGEPITVTSDPNVPIPDGDPVGVSDTIDMGMSFNIIDLEVDLVINHSWTGDLCVKLSKDGGPEVTLIQRMNLDAPCDATGCCGCSSNDMDITLDDEAADPIEDQCGAGGGLLTGTYVPDEPLANFVGGDSAGAWTLTVNDNAGADTGTLVSWSLVFAQPASGGTTPCEEAFPDQCATEQTLIIKQGACPAPVNPNSNGVIPMALVGDMDFDVSMVVLDSLQLHLCDGEGGIAPLNGPPGPKIHVGDINHPFDLEISCEEGPCACNEDQSSDGIADLLLKFSTDELMAAFGDALVPGAVVILELTGDMTEGPGFFARDCIQVVPPGGVMPANFAVEANAPRAYTELLPWDMNLDTDGFANFVRAYAPGETVTLTADLFAPDGTKFDHWMVNGVTWRQGIRTITVTATENMSLEAIYVGPQPSHGRPAPAGWNN